MSYEVIKSIVEAEKKAEEIKNNAIVEASEIKKNAKINSEELVEKAKKEGLEAKGILTEKAVGLSKTEVAEILEKAEKACSEIEVNAKNKIDLAVEAAIRKVVGIDGNS